MPKETLEFQFSIGEKVTLIAIDRPGRVNGQINDAQGLQYRVIYWDQSQRKTEWVFADELKTAT